jgi:hypothetical protein
MDTKAFLFLSLALVGCVDYNTIDGFYSFPSGTQLTKNVDTSEAKAAWMSAGLPDPSHCDPMAEAVVDYKNFNEFCRVPSCYDPNWQTINPRGCAYACTQTIEQGFPVMFYSDPQGDTLPHHSEEDEIAHEVFHVWSHCLLRSTDPGHANKQIWNTALLTATGEGR